MVWGHSNNPCFHRQLVWQRPLTRILSTEWAEPLAVKHDQSASTRVLHLFLILLKILAGAGCKVSRLLPKPE